jgi:hypothetical protein
MLGAMNFARRAAAVVAGVIAITFALTGAASAAVPNGWAPHSNPSALDILRYVLFIPLGVGVVITLLVLLPGVLRGEGFLPKAPQDHVDAPTPFLHED